MAQRQRTRGAITTGDSYIYKLEWGSCGSSLSQTPGQLYGTGERQIMYDQVVPDFHRKRARGEVFFTNMFTEKIKAQRSGSIGPVRYDSSPLNCSGILRTTRATDIGNSMEVWYHRAVASTTNPAPGELPVTRELLSGSDIDDLIIEHSTKVQNARGRSDFNAWETLAEADKTLGTLTGIFKGAQKYFGRVPPGRRVSTDTRRFVKDLVKESSSQYLATRFGIMPVIADVSAALEGFNAKVGRMRKTSRSTGNLKAYAERKLQYAGTTATMSFSERSYDEVEVRAMSLDEFFASKAHNLGLTSKGLVTLPWELVKKSFVLDWFLTMGDFLGAITPSLEWSQLGSCVVTRRKQRLEIDVLSTTSSGRWVIVSPAQGNYTLSRESTWRSPGLPRPSVVVKSDFRFTNLVRCMDAFTLFAQRALNKR